MEAITEVLRSLPKGEGRSAEELIPLVYHELRRLAASRLAGERPGQTLQATALVHEAWMRLEREEGRSFNDRQHFFCAAATAMRRILIDNARRKQTVKHGGHLQRVDAAETNLVCPLPDDQLLAVDEALDRLAAVNERAADVVKLRFFAGMTQAQIAECLGFSVATVERTWTFARAWLYAEIREDLGFSPGVREKPPDNRL